MIIAQEVIPILMFKGVGAEAIKRHGKDMTAYYFILGAIEIIPNGLLAFYFGIMCIEYIQYLKFNDYKLKIIFSMILMNLYSAIYWSRYIFIKPYTYAVIFNMPDDWTMKELCETNPLPKYLEFIWHILQQFIYIVIILFLTWLLNLLNYFITDDKQAEFMEEEDGSNTYQATQTLNSFENNPESPTNRSAHCDVTPVFTTNIV